MLHESTLAKEKCSQLRKNIITSHSEAFIILQTSKLKVSDFLKNNKNSYTHFFFFFCYDKGTLNKNLFYYYLFLNKVPCDDGQFINYYTHFAFSFDTTQHT